MKIQNHSTSGYQNYETTLGSIAADFMAGPDKENMKLPVRAQAPVNVNRLVCVCACVAIFSLAVVVRKMSKMKSIAKMTKLFMMNLCLADFILISGLLLRSLVMLYPPKRHWTVIALCRVCGAFVCASIGVSATTTLQFAVRTYKCIRTTQINNNDDTSKTFGVSVALTWIVWTVISMSPFLGAEVLPDQTCHFNIMYSEQFMNGFCLFFGVTTVAFTATQILAVVKIREHSKFWMIMARTTRGEAKKRLLKRKSSILKTLGFLWMAFLACDGPLMVLLPIYNLCPNRCGILFQALAVAVMVIPSRVVINIFIYVIRFSELRQMVCDTFAKCRRVTRRVGSFESTAAANIVTLAGNLNQPPSVYN
jgi:hypothetical protein